MADRTTDESIRKMAEEIFDLTKLSWRQRLASRHQGEEELSESQFLTLDGIVTRGEPQTVGDLQRAIHVVPAQMSRIIRSLENDFDSPLIRCELNQEDKRKIDVRLTDAGREAYSEFVRSRIGRTLELLSQLEQTDRLDFIRVCGQMRKLYDRNEVKEN
jgi:DNA-binding MarR family transcriptional regulator